MTLLISQLYLPLLRCRLIESTDHHHVVALWNLITLSNNSSCIYLDARTPKCPPSKARSFAHHCFLSTIPDGGIITEFQFPYSSTHSSIFPFLSLMLEHRNVPFTRPRDSYIVTPQNWA